MAPQRDLMSPIPTSLSSGVVPEHWPKRAPILPSMLQPEDYEDVVVTVAHSWGDVETPLPRWIETGPGPRPYTGIVQARRLSTGEELALAEIPLEYHNSPESRGLQRQGLLPTPWGAPPEGEP
jgi:hypothetical protein